MDFFGQMGFDFGNMTTDSGEFTPLIQSKPVVKKEAPAKKDAKKTSKKSSSKPKDNKAKGIKVNYPVTVYGRSFRETLEGEGETNIQAVAEKLLELGYDEVMHKNVKFFKAGDNVVVLSYSGLIETVYDVKVSLPVTVVDGQKKATYEESENLGVTDKDEDVKVHDLCGVGINDPHYGEECKLDYDVTSNIAVPIITASVVSEKNNVLLNAGTVIYYPGGSVILEEPCSADGLAKEYLGEVPEGAQVFFSDEDGSGMARFLYFDFKEGERVSIDRSEFDAVEDDAKTEKVKEKISLPCAVNIPLLAQTIEVTPEDLGGATKVVWEDMLKHLRTRVNVLGSSDRRVDYVYDSVSNTLGVGIFSGTKGGY